MTEGCGASKWCRAWLSPYRRTIFPIRSRPDGPKVKQVLEAVGVSESSLDRIRLAQGVVGKSSYVAAVALLALLVVAYSLKDSGYLMVVGFIILLLFFVYFGGVLWFATKHPDMALLEGAELVKWRQIDMAAKGQPSLPNSTQQVIGSESSDG
jgi:hypothetical protein